MIYTNTEFFTLNSALVGENTERREIVFQRIYAVLKEGVCFGRDVLFRLDLAIQDGRGQCYDCPATMSGKKAGVATLFKLLNPKMFYTHYYEHALNLAVKDACFKVNFLKEAFEISREVINLVKDSPQRDTKLKDIRSEKINTEKCACILSDAMDCSQQTFVLMKTS